MWRIFISKFIKSFFYILTLIIEILLGNAWKSCYLIKISLDSLRDNSSNEVDFLLFLADDAVYFLSKPQTTDIANSSSYEIVQADPDNDILTQQDLDCREKGLPLKIYDAFVIYNDKDVEFATELIERCENLGYSLCVKDRDLLGGLSFESDAILNLLSKRCNRLIIIVSKAFLKSPMQIFITNFAQALGIEQGKRKIVPCLLEPCDLPQMLRFCFRLDYYRNNKLFDFWDKLDKSLKVATDMKKSNALENNRFVTEENFERFYVCGVYNGDGIYVKKYRIIHFWRRVKRFMQLCRNQKSLKVETNV